MYKWILSCLICLFISINSKSQNLRCINNDPLLSVNQPINLRSTPPILKLVIHVVYQSEEENIPDNQILNQLEILNDAFNTLYEEETKASGALPITGVSGIQFELADKDSLGFPTSGIIRVKTDLKDIGDLEINGQNAVKYSELGGSDAWDTNQYINIWIAKRDISLGYTVGLDSIASSDEGIIINYANFGLTEDVPYHLGKTLVHEMGHYLGLFHPWISDDHPFACFGHSGSIKDLYTSRAPAQGCLPPPRCYGKPFVGNYMDFYDDECMFYFTRGQCMWMQATLEQFRPSLMNDGSMFPDYLPEESNVLINFTGRTIEVYSTEQNPLVRINIYVINGQIASTIKMEGKYYEQISLSNFTSGIYFLEVLTTNSRKVEKIYIP